MKYTFYAALLAATALTLAACGEKKEGETQAPSTQESTPTTPVEPAPTPEQAPAPEQAPTAPEAPKS